MPPPSLNKMPPRVKVKKESPQLDFGDSNADFGKANVTQEASQLSLLEKSLALNEAMRNTLCVEMQRLHSAIRKNKEKQRLLRELIAESAPSKNAGSRNMSCIRAISVFAAPYFRDIKKMAPPLNKDAQIKSKRHDVNAYLKPPKPWHTSEYRKLNDGIISYALLTALKPYKRKRDHLRSKLKDQNLTDEDIEHIKNMIEIVEDEANKIKKLTKAQLLETLDESQIDWFTISSTNLQGARTPEDCEQMYFNFLSSNINKGQFSKEEDARLQQLAETYGERDWDAIAKALGTQRSAIQCFDRYQTKLNATLKRTFWTPEEDEKLLELVKANRIGHIIPWSRISHFMPGRTRQQIINRYDRSVSQLYNRVPWTTEEDAMVIACVLKFGLHSWAKVKNFFKRRSSYAIRERYVNALQPDIKVGSWSKDEDRLLVTLIKKHGYGKWSKICQHIPGRTDNMCLTRATRMLEYSVKYHSANGNDYNIEEFDPKLFARILKPLPARGYNRKKIKEKTARAEAIEVLLSTLKKVAPYIQFEEGNLNSLDGTQLNVDVLQRLSVEFHEIIQKQEQEKEPLVQKSRYYKKTRYPFKKMEISDTESDDDECLSSDTSNNATEKALSTREKEWLIGVLNRLFETVAKLMPPLGGKSPFILNSRETAEATLYRAFLYKQFHCSTPYDPGDDLQNVVFAGVDYTETLQTVVSYFVQPPIYDNHCTVLAPNMTTLHAFEAIEATENRLDSMAELVRYSEPYVDYLCEKDKNSPKCLKCLLMEGTNISAQVSPEIMISDMKGENFVVDETMEKAAYIESANPDVCTGTCSCSALEKSREAVRRLRERFLGIFLWPVLMSATKLSEEQEKIICTTKGRKKDYFWKVVQRSTVKKVPETFDNPSSTQASAAGINVPKVRRKRQRRYPLLSPDQLRKSKRQCVINHSSSSYQRQSLQCKAIAAQLEQEQATHQQPDQKITDKQPLPSSVEREHSGSDSCQNIQSSNSDQERENSSFNDCLNSDNHL